MHRASIFVLAVLLHSLRVYAQTPAQRALNNEPEARQIQAMSAAVQQQQGLPKDDESH